MKTITFYNDVLPIDLVGAEVIYPIEMKCYTHFFDQIVKRTTFENFENEFVCFFRRVVDEKLDLFLFLDLTTNKIFGISIPEVGRSDNPFVTRVRPKEIFQSIVEGFVEYWSGLEGVEIIGLPIEEPEPELEEPEMVPDSLDAPVDPNQSVGVTQQDESETGSMDSQPPTPHIEDTVDINDSIDNLESRWLEINKSLNGSNIMAEALYVNKGSESETIQLYSVEGSKRIISLTPMAKDVSFKLLEGRVSKGHFDLPTIEEIHVIVLNLNLLPPSVTRFIPSEPIIWCRDRNGYKLVKVDLDKKEIKQTLPVFNINSRCTEDGLSSFMLFPVLTIGE